MGLFDSVYIDLPSTGINPMTEFQTKDIDGMWCRRVDITSAGRLVLHDVEYEAAPKSERVFPDAPDGSLAALGGCLREKSKTLRDLDYHGILWLHNCDTGKQWRAKFTDGNLVELGEAE